MDFTDELRQDWEVKQAWEGLRKHCVEGTMTVKDLLAKCSEEGISVGSLSSPPNILWELYAFEMALQLLVDEFHNLAEGHGHILYNLFQAFTPAAERVIEPVWNDPNTWDPLKTGE